MNHASYSPLLSPEELASLLVRWYDTVHTHRDMPWRQTRDPYAIWLSETMLQQTQVETVKPYYRRFLARFPTVSHLAAAPLEDVLTMWAGLGYYRRAKHLHRAAQKIAAEFGGQVPGTIEDLATLPGVGRYTAGAVGSIAFGLPAAVVDGNVMRVLARLTGYDRDIADAHARAFFWEKAEQIVKGAPGKRYGDVNQAMMELGATVCVPPPARPACLLCPLRDACRAFALGKQMELPVKSARKATPVVQGFAIIAVRKEQKQVLLMRRPEGGTWEGMWEFPVLQTRRAQRTDRKLERKTGRRAGATQKLRTWIESALGVAVAGDVVDLGEVRHQLTHRLMIYRVMHCTVDKGAPRLPECGHGRYEAARWVNWPLEEPGELPMARVVRKIAHQAAEGPGRREKGAKQDRPAGTTGRKQI